MADHGEPLIPGPIRPLDTVEPPAFRVPPGACDTHMHVFGPMQLYPPVAHPHYTRPPGDLGHYRRLAERLGLQRFVIVQPSFYGTDNRCLLDALATSGDAARGVVMVEEDVDDEALRGMHMAGVRGVRLDLFKRAPQPTATLRRYIEAMAARVAPLGWHLQFYAPGPVVRDLLPYLRGLEIDHVIDHMGYMKAADGLTDGDFQRLLDLLRHGRGWLKLSAPYRLAGGRGYSAVENVAKAIIAAAPERAIWGSDWPHIPGPGDAIGCGRDTGELLNLLGNWAPDDGVRRLVLSDNPQQLFGW